MEYTRDIADIIKKAHMIICADGGAGHLRALNILPDILIGDFDSIKSEDKIFFENKKIKILDYPPEKNHTDTQLCVSCALEHKASDITFFGVTGTRMDHTLANIFLLTKLARLNIAARIMNRHNEIYAVTDFMEIRGKPKEFLSIIPATRRVTGITLSGLEYPLKDASLEMGDSLGISNVFKKNKASISVRSGILIVTRSKD